MVGTIVNFLLTGTLLVLIQVRSLSAKKNSIFASLTNLRGVIMTWRLHLSNFSWIIKLNIPVMAGGRIYALQVKSFPHILEVIMWETGIAEVSQRRWFGWKFPVKFRGRPLSVPFMRISSRWNGRKREWFDWFPITHSPITVSFEPWVNKPWRWRKRKLSTFYFQFGLTDGERIGQ